MSQAAMQRALVLGAGGNAGIAWEIGVIAGLADEGIDVSHADLLVGTSAGSVVAAMITSGLALEEVFRRQVDPGLQVQEPPPPIDFTQWRAGIRQAKDGAASPAEALRRVGALPPAAPDGSGTSRRDIIAARLPVHTWPERMIKIVAVNADTGERRVFERGDGVPLVDAVAASCAVAGIWPAVPIGGWRYIDGGFYSIDNADLAAGCERVLVITFPARVPPLAVASLEEALERLRGEGARIEVVHPDRGTEAAIASAGGNVLDPSVRGGAARAGREQGRAIAARVAAGWL